MFYLCKRIQREVKFGKMLRAFGCEVSLILKCRDKYRDADVAQLARAADL